MTLSKLQQNTSIKLSIISPVFNAKDFIGLCIENVVAQNCREAEHIIVDGGSTDGTIEIVKEYAKRLPHIQLLSEKDKGQSDAMNKGIGLAKGKILGFLNVDDYYEPGTLNRILSLFDGVSEPSFLAANCRIWKDDGSFDLHTPKDLRFISLVKKKSPHPYNPSAYFYHRSLHHKVGLYDVEDHYSMDLDFILRAVRKAHCYYFDEVWGNMRFRAGSKTFEDNAEGKAIKRLKAVLKKHWDKAPWHIKFRYNAKSYYNLITGSK